MYVCMYVCMYDCMYVCMYLRMYDCMYVCMYVCMTGARVLRQASLVRACFCRVLRSLDPWSYLDLGCNRTCLHRPGELLRMWMRLSCGHASQSCLADSRREVSMKREKALSLLYIYIYMRVNSLVTSRSCWLQIIKEVAFRDAS